MSSLHQKAHLSNTLLTAPFNSTLTYCNYNSTDIIPTQSQTTHHALDSRIQVNEPRGFGGALSSSKCFCVIFATTPCISLSLNEQAGGGMRRTVTKAVETESGKDIVGRQVGERPFVNDTNLRRVLQC